MKGYSAVKVNSKRGGGIKSIQGVIQEACKEKIERQKARDLKPPGACNGRWDSECRKINVYQCTGREKPECKTGNKPGVTKGKQWIRLNKNVELLGYAGYSLAEV